MITTPTRRIIALLFLALGCLLGTLPAAAAEQAPGRVLRVVGDDNYPPFLFRDEAGRSVGYVADWWALWEKKTGVRVELKATRWADAQHSLLKGEADVIDNIFRTPQREQLYDFTPPYARVPVDIFTHATISGIKDVKGLRGFQVGAMEGDACVDMLQAQGIGNFRLYQSYSALIHAALSEEVKLFCMDEYPANYYLYQQQAQKAFVKAFQLYQGEFHRAVRKGDLATLRLVEEGAAAISADEERALREKWFNPPARDYQRLFHYLATGAAVLGILALALLCWLRSTRNAVRRQTEQLRDSEQRYRLLFEHAADAVIICNMGARVITANNQACRQYGYTLEQFQRLTIADLTIPEQAEQTPERIAAVFRDGQAFFESRHRNAMGIAFPVEVKVVKILFGNQPAMMSVIRDITGRKQAEEELAAHQEELERLVGERTAELTRLAESVRRSNEEQKAILDSAGAGIVLLKGRTILRCNRRMEEMYGYLPGEMAGVTTQQLCAAHERGAGEEEDRFAEVASRGETYHADHHALRKDGSTFWVHASMRAVNPADLDQGVVAIIDDITDERAAAQALQEANNKLNDTLFALESVGTSVFWVDFATGRILFANRHAAEALGYTQQELMELSVPDIDPDYPAEALPPIYEEIRKQGFMRFDTTNLRKDGSTFPVEMSVYYQEAKEGNPPRLVVFGVDITRRKENEQELREARDAAEAASRAKSDFLANMSHEIRTPLNAIIGLTHITLKTELTARQRDHQQKILAASRHLLEVLNDILDYSKIDAAKVTIEQLEFDLETVLGTVTSQLVEKCSAKGVELIVDIDRKVPLQLIGDPLRLGQVLLNLASNAVKFTGEGEIEIRVELAGEKEDDLLLRFLVRDTGIGLTKEQQGLLFQSFQQADGSTTRQYGGTGLGLAIAKGLTELMGGQIGVGSKAGAGSTFWFTACLRRVPSQAPAPAPAPDLRGKRILVVESSRRLCEVLVGMLKNLGFAVTAVSSGSAALDELARGKGGGTLFDVVLIDREMPEMDVVPLAGSISGLELDPPPKLAIITRCGDEELASEAQEAGIGELIVKPVTPSTLLDSMVNLLGSSASTRQTAEQRTAEPDLSAIAGARLLLVEDNDINQEVALDLLKGAGFAVDLAANGAIAVESVRDNDYDLVLMDVQMPVMDGLMATRKIRLLPGRDRLPIVAMTANAMLQDRERCLEAGMNDHVGKPINPEELWDKLLHWIEPRQAGNASSPWQGWRDEEAAAVLDGIDGLDVGRGLSLAMGKERLYLSLVRRFVGTQRDFPRRLAEAVAGPDWSHAERLVHTLKGSTAQIGAAGLHEAVTQLEEAVRNRSTGRLAGLQSAVAGRLAELIESIAGRLLDFHPQASAVHPHEDAVRETLAKLGALLSEDDPRAGEVLEESEQLFSTVLGPDFDPVAKAIRNFSFDEALDLLKEAAAKRGLSL
ncbi:MAG TPA: PAS domain S-box protein [Geomonas sp.]|nr:PAS domain S-box protein [Geomonas sp.]